MTQEYVIRLGTLCDSVLFNYISEIADSPAKRDHLWVVHTIVLQQHGMDGIWFEFEEGGDFERLSRFLDFHTSDFPLALETEGFKKFFGLRQAYLLGDYLNKFLSDPGRSKVFHYDRARWSAFVATLTLRCLRTW